MGKCKEKQAQNIDSIIQRVEDCITTRRTNLSGWIQSSRPWYMTKWTQGKQHSKDEHINKGNYLCINFIYQGTLNDHGILPHISIVLQMHRIFLSVLTIWTIWIYELQNILWTDTCAMSTHKAIRCTIMAIISCTWIKDWRLEFVFCNKAWTTLDFFDEMQKSLSIKITWHVTVYQRFVCLNEHNTSPNQTSGIGKKFTPLDKWKIIAIWYNFQQF